MTDKTVLGRFDAERLRHLLDDAGVFAALEGKGFASFDIVVQTAGYALPHVCLFGRKLGERLLLLDACLGEATVREPFFRARGFAVQRPIEFTVVHWLCEQDPTAGFSAERPALPLQRHPGLGILRQAFRALIQIAQELGKDGIVNVPKFFHDALIFFQSRLFLFLDGREQGRFEALARVLASMSMGDASLAVIGGGVRNADGTALPWVPGYQVFPLSDLVTAYFHSADYAARVDEGRAAARFVVDMAAVRRAQGLATARENA